MTRTGQVARMGELKKAYKVFVGNPEVKRPLWIPGHGWEHIRVGVRETEWKSVDWIHLAQNRDKWRAFV